MANVVLPARNILSASLPDGDLEVFSRSWRLLVSDAGAVATLVLPSGGAVALTFGGMVPEDRTIAGSATTIWITGVTSQQLLPPLAPEDAPAGGLPLPI
jgi:hypothetical protein